MCIRDSILIIIFLPAGLYGELRQLMLRRTAARATARVGGRRAESVE